MPHSGSAFSTSSNTFCDARYQNECWYSIAWSKSFCASGLHDVSKCTLPSLLSSTCPKAGWASEISAAPAKAITVVFEILLMMFSRSNGLSTAQLANTAFSENQALSRRPQRHHQSRYGGHFSTLLRLANQLVFRLACHCKASDSMISTAGYL